MIRTLSLNLEKYTSLLVIRHSVFTYRYYVHTFELLSENIRRFSYITCAAHCLQSGPTHSTKHIWINGQKVFNTQSSITINELVNVCLI